MPFPTQTLVLFSWQPLLSSRPFVYWKREGEERSGGTKGWLGGRKGWKLDLKGWFHERDCWCVDVGTAVPLWSNPAGRTEGCPRRCLNAGMEHWGPQGAIPTAFSPGSSQPSCRTSGMASPSRQESSGRSGKAALSHSALPGDTSSLN